MFAHLQRLSMTFYDREKAGVIVSRMTSDVDSLAELVQMGLLMFVANGLLLVFSFAVLAVVSWQLLLVSLVALPFVVAASVKFHRDSNRAYLLVRDRIGSTLSRLQEGLSGVRVIQAYAREDRQVERFTATSRELYEAHMDSVRISAWYLPVIELAGLVSTAAAVGVGGWLVHEDVDHHRDGHVLRPDPLEPVRTGAAAQPALQHGAVGRRRASTSCTGCWTPCPMCAEVAAPVELSAARRADGVGRVLLLRRQPTGSCCRTCRCGSSRGSGSRWSGRPAPASRPSPS